MIVNIFCAFCLGCFVITSNIKTIESATSKVCPLQLFYPLCTGRYSNTVNSLKTFNRHPIVIKTVEQKILAKTCRSYKDMKLKKKMMRKIEKKIQDIKCSFGVIAKSNVSHLKGLVDNYKRRGHCIDNRNTVQRLKVQAGIMVNLLLHGNMATDKWLWIYYLKIVAVGQWADNEHFIRENPFEDQQLQTVISDFIGYCKAEKYLPPAKTESDLLPTNPDIVKNMFNVLHASGMFLDISYGLEVVTVEFLYLKPFWHDENRQLLFGQISREAHVDWSEAKRRHELEVAVTEEFVENRTWIYKPYGRLDHQHLLIEILDARFYCYLAVVLHIYEKQLTMLGEPSLTHIKFLIKNIIIEVLKFTSFKDDFLLNILSEFNYANVGDVDDIKDILARVKTKANAMLYGLNGAGKIESDWIGYNVTEHRQLLSTEDLIVRIIEDFQRFLNKLKWLLLPFEYQVLLYFTGVVKRERLS